MWGIFLFSLQISYFNLQKMVVVKADGSEFSVNLVYQILQLTEQKWSD